MPLQKDSFVNNRYRILEVLGQGGMGTVFRALDENLGVEVALKENLFTTDEYSRQFRREATILASMRHKNLPRVSDHFEIEGQGQYLIMDYIEGEDLRQRMDRLGILEDDEVIVIGAAICDALEYMHNRRPVILHRDIKPGNVKISPDGVVFLVDFGLAKVVSGTQATTTGARAMTPGYSSPEQYGTARTDHRSDIYSLGATLYAALTGVIPEDGLARAMDQVDLTPVRKRNAKVGRRLATVLDKALAVHPEDRYQSAAEFKTGLLGAGGPTRSLNSELTVAPPPPEVVKAIAEGRHTASNLLTEPEYDMSGESSTRRRKRLMKILGRVAVGVVAVAALGGFWYFNGPGAIIVERERTPNATEPFVAVAETDTPPAGETATPEATEEAAVLPTLEVTIAPLFPDEADVLAFASNRTGSFQIWVQSLESRREIQITNIPGGACQPEWSPDGSRIAFTSPCRDNQDVYVDARLYMINVDGTGLTVLPTGVGSSDPSWSPDGRFLLYTLAFDSIRSHIYRLDLESGESVYMTGEDKLNFDPVWSPDGERFVFVSTRQGGYRLYVKENDPDAEAQTLTRSGEKYNSQPSWTPDGLQVVFIQRPSPQSGPGQLYRVSMEMLNITNSLVYQEFRVSAGLVVEPEVDPDVSNDGFRIAYEGWPDGENHDIWVMFIDGTNRTRITTDPAVDFDPAWRPSQP
ncbi:MAG: serine/threonine-protein kinase [Chloroflexi bacterium]|nr:serine/threonine-protein kinase [Chloroflexota bacterium]